MTPKVFKSEFAKYELAIIREFIRLCLPSPIVHRKYQYISIKTIEGIPLKVWGNSLEEIWSLFRDFQKMEVFL